MHVLNIHGEDDVRLDVTDHPRPGHNDVVVAVKNCGICGSDLSYIKIGGIHRRPDGVTPLGHEVAGEIAWVGDGVIGVQLGQRVVVNPMLTPGYIGSGGPEGGFTELLLVRGAELGKSLLLIPDQLPYELAALAEPLAVALHGVNRSQAKAGDKVAVFGCGPIGLGMILWLADRGITDIVALDLAPERLERARQLGATATINPAIEDVRARLLALHGSSRLFSRDAIGTDVYLDAAGAPNLAYDVVRMAKFHARMVVTAAYMKPVQIDLGAMLTTEMTLTTAVGYPTEMTEVLASLPRLRNEAASLISHRLPFGQVIDGLKLAGTAQAAKVMIAM